MIWDKYNDFTLGNKFYHRILKSSFLNWKVSSFNISKLWITLMINIIININTKFVFIYKVWFSTVTAFLKIAKLYFSFRSVSILKNYRLINRYRPVWSNLAIGIGKIQYRSTSTIDNIQCCRPFPCLGKCASWFYWLSMMNDLITIIVRNVAEFKIHQRYKC